MFKTLFSRKWVRKGILLLVWQAVVVALAWFLYKQMHWGKYFSDTLFVIGCLQVMTASVGMIGRPYAMTGGGYGVNAGPVQPTEKELGEQMRDEFFQKRSFAQRLAISGAITLVLAVIALYW